MLGLVVVTKEKVRYRCTEVTIKIFKEYKMKIHRRYFEKQDSLLDIFVVSTPLFKQEYC